MTPGDYMLLFVMNRLSDPCSKNYGMRWNGTGGINSSVKRKYGERLKSRKPETLECGRYQRFW